MKLTSVKNVMFDGVHRRYDLIIAASGYESRARHIAERFSSMGVDGEIRIVLRFLEHSSACARPENDRVFLELGYRDVDCHGNSGSEVIAYIQSALETLDSREELRVFVDISSMTRAWYGAIVRALRVLEKDVLLAVQFGYTASKFCPPPAIYPPNRIVSPVEGFVGNGLPDRPTALVVGLGYDTGRAIGLKDHLDPQLTILFYSDPASDSRFVREVLKANSGLIKEVGPERVFNYSFSDGAGTFIELESLCKGISFDWRVVLCSLGPKIFGLCAFLVAALNREISIWRVSADSDEEPVDHHACGSPTVIETIWRSS